METFCLVVFLRYKMCQSQKIQTEAAEGEKTRGRQRRIARKNCRARGLRSMMQRAWNRFAKGYRMCMA